MNAMRDALRDCRAIWRVTTTQREAGVGRMMWSVALPLLGAALLLIVLSGRARTDIWMVGRVLLGAGALWLLLVWAMLFMPGTILLNSVTHARLLPRQRRRLVQMAVGGWLLVTAVGTVVFANWTLFPVVGLYVLALGSLGIGTRHAVTLFFLASNAALLSRSALPPALVSFAGSGMARAALALLLLPAGAWMLRRVYPAGGDAHFDRRQAQVKRLKQFEGSTVPTQFEGGLVPRIYAAALRRDCRHARRAAAPGRLLLHALGPAMHWSAWARPACVMLAAAMAVRLLLDWRGGTRFQDFVDGASLPMLCGMAVAMVAATAQLNQSMKRTRGEQSLLRLAPLTGDASLLNRHLAAQLLQAALRLWVGLTAVMLIVSVLVAGPDALLRQFGLCCLAGQAALMGLLGDYAGAGGWSLALAWRAALLAALEAAVAVGLGWISGTSIWLWMAAVAIGCAVFHVRRAWRIMLAAPVAFPARRTSQDMSLKA